MTSTQKSRRARNPTARCVSGGDKGVRSPDLVTASHALSQLSYIPAWCGSNYTRLTVRVNTKFEIAITGGLDRVTLRENSGICVLRRASGARKSEFLVS